MTASWRAPSPAAATISTTLPFLLPSSFLSFAPSATASAATTWHSDPAPSSAAMGSGGSSKIGAFVVKLVTGRRGRPQGSV